MRKIEHYSAGHFKSPFLKLAWKRPALTCHCLIIHENDKVLLVDCGMHPDHLSSRLPALLNKSLLGAKISKAETMKSHLNKQGISAEQVTDILITHLHYDHCGGLPDFPKARIHLHKKEWDWARKNTGSLQKNTQVVASTFEHIDSPELYSEFNQKWNGFSVTSLRGVSSDILMVPLPGHSPGHCGFIVPNKDETIFHAGDAFFIIDDLDNHLHATSITSELIQVGLAYNAKLRLETIQKINQLRALNIKGLKIVNSHDQKLLDSV